MIRPASRRPAVSAAIRPALAALLAATLSGHLLGGCLGGNSTEAGNPELVIGFRNGGQPVQFMGYMQVFADSVNPGFYTPQPDDGSKSSADERPSISTGSSNVFYTLRAGERQFIDGASLARATDYRILLPRLPAAAVDEDFQIAVEEIPDGSDSVQPFNMRFLGQDGAVAIVQGLTYDPAARKYRGADGASFDVLWVDLSPAADFSGTVDTAGFQGKPLMVFSPGLPIAAQVHGNSFHLPGLPLTKLPMQLITEDGIVFAFTKPIDATGGKAGSFDNTLPPLVPDRTLDTLVLPLPLGVLDLPTASPAGPLKFTESVTVTLSAQGGTTLYYTTDGTEPGLASLQYASPIVLRGSAEIKAVAYRKGINHSAVSTNSYVKVPTAPIANPASMAFRDSVVVSLASGAAGGDILYTLDGSPPKSDSPVYSRPLVLRTTTVLKAVTSVSGLSLSEVTEERYILVPDTLSQH